MRFSSLFYFHQNVLRLYSLFSHEGYTHNIEIRLSKHNAGATPSTRGGRPWELVYSEEYIDKSSALFREREIKSKKSRKYIEHLVAKG